MFIEHLGERVAGWSGQVWRSARWGLLLVLLLSFVAVLLRVVPASGSTRGLVADIRAGRTHAVQMDAEGTSVTVRWSTGPFTVHGYVYRPTSFVAGTAEAARDFEETVRQEVGPSAEAVHFRAFDATYGAGGLGLLIPVVYVLLTPWWWLSLLAVLAGLGVLVRILTARQHRLASGPAWALVGLLTGVGLVGYLCVEPGSESAAPAGAPHWWRAWLVTLVTGAGMAMVAILALLAGGRL